VWLLLICQEKLASVCGIKILIQSSPIGKYNIMCDRYFLWLKTFAIWSQIIKQVFCIFHFCGCIKSICNYVSLHPGGDILFLYFLSVCLSVSPSVCLSQNLVLTSLLRRLTVETWNCVQCFIIISRCAYCQDRRIQ
jgi:hypothetical protein